MAPLCEKGALTEIPVGGELEAVAKLLKCNLHIKMHVADGRKKRKGKWHQLAIKNRASVIHTLRRDFYGAIATPPSLPLTTLFPCVSGSSVRCYRCRRVDAAACLRARVVAVDATAAAAVAVAAVDAPMPSGTTLGAATPIDPMDGVGSPGTEVEVSRLPTVT